MPLVVRCARAMADVSEELWAQAVAEAEQRFGRQGVCTERHIRTWTAAPHPNGTRITMTAALVREGTRVEIEHSRPALPTWPRALAVLCWAIALLLSLLLSTEQQEETSAWWLVLAFSTIPLVIAGGAIILAWTRTMRQKRASNQVLDRLYTLAWEHSAVEVQAEEILDEGPIEMGEVPPLPNQWLDDDEIDWLAAEPRVARASDLASDVFAASRRARRRASEPRPTEPLPTPPAEPDFSDLWAQLQDDPSAAARARPTA